MQEVKSILSTGKCVFCGKQNKELNDKNRCAPCASEFQEVCKKVIEKNRNVLDRLANM